MIVAIPAAAQELVALDLFDSACVQHFGNLRATTDAIEAMPDWTKQPWEGLAYGEGHMWWQYIDGEPLVVGVMRGAPNPLGNAVEACAVYGVMDLQEVQQYIADLGPGPPVQTGPGVTEYRVRLYSEVATLTFVDHARSGSAIIGLQLVREWRADER